MPRTVAQDDALLVGARPELVSRYKAMRDRAAAQGFTVRVAPWTGAVVRTQADTALHLRNRDAEYALYVADMKRRGKVPLPINTWRPIAPYGQSRHNYGGAVDVAVSPDTAANRAALWKIAAAVGLEDGRSYNDPLHFQLPESFAAAKSAWAKLGQVVGNAATAVTTAAAKLPRSDVGALVALVALGALFTLSD